MARPARPLRPGMPGARHRRGAARTAARACPAAARHDPAAPAGTLRSLCVARRRRLAPDRGLAACRAFLALAAAPADRPLLPRHDGRRRLPERQLRAGLDHGAGRLLARWRGLRHRSGAAGAAAARTAPAIFRRMSSDATRILTTVRARGALPMIGAFVRAYPGRSAAALVAVFVAGLMDGLGMSMLLSMLTLTTAESNHKPSLPEQVATRIAEFLGLQPTAPVLLVLAIVLIALKAVLTLLANKQVGYTVAHIATDLRLALIRAVMSARWSHYLQQSVGRLSNSVATEAQRASEAFQYSAEMAAMLLNALIYMGIALSISWQAGLATAIAGGLLLSVLHTLIRSSRRAGQHQTQLLTSLLSAIGAQLAAAKPLKAMAREDHVDALLSDQMKQLRRALRRQVVSREALGALQDPLLAIMVGTGFFLSLVVLKMPLAAVLVMLFLLARVVSYVSKAQRAYQQIVVRESAYWSLIDGIGDAHAQVE
ncbi:MAG: ABC transporter ATP-binding protein, partial [Variovorax sp.]